MNRSRQLTAVKRSLAAEEMLRDETHHRCGWLGRIQLAEHVTYVLRRAALPACDDRENARFLNAASAQLRGVPPREQERKEVFKTAAKESGQSLLQHSHAVLGIQAAEGHEVQRVVTAEEQTSKGIGQSDALRRGLEVHVGGWSAGVHLRHGDVNGPTDGIVASERLHIHRAEIEQIAGSPLEITQHILLLAIIGSSERGAFC